MPGQLGYNPPVKRVLALALAAAALGGAASSSAGTTTIVSFRMPSKNIACAYMTGFGKPSLRCDILSGLKPKPSGRCREGDWSSLYMTRRGKARPLCVSDSVYNPKAPVLRYGHTWKRGGFTCHSKRKGLKCSNLAGHGFFLSRERWSVH